MAPSREMSVQIMVRTPRACIWSKKVSQVFWLVSSQPLMATLPSFRSAPTAILSPYWATAWAVKSGSVTAAVPKITRLAPASRYRRTVSILRMPPPTSTKRPVWAAIRSMVGRLVVWPVLAPSRSTRWRWVAPAASNCATVCRGSAS